jgi:ABC-type transport system involved in cytochrome bd biosynthesis fused ATPase/permease subunit
MKNTHAIRSTIIFTVVILLAVFLLLNALAQGNTQGHQGKGRNGFQQKVSGSQELLLQEKHRQKQLTESEYNSNNVQELKQDQLSQQGKRKNIKE